MECNFPEFGNPSVLGKEKAQDDPLERRLFPVTPIYSRTAL